MNWLRVSAHQFAGTAEKPICQGEGRSASGFLGSVRPPLQEGDLARSLLESRAWGFSSIKRGCVITCMIYPAGKAGCSAPMHLRSPQKCRPCIPKDGSSDRLPDNVPPILCFRHVRLSLLPYPLPANKVQSPAHLVFAILKGNWPSVAPEPLSVTYNSASERSLGSKACLSLSHPQMVIAGVRSEHVVQCISSYLGRNPITRIHSQS